MYSSSPISRPSFKPLAQILFEISCWQDFILIFSKGHNSRKWDNSDKKKKMCDKYFSMRNPYMKFQNPSMHGSLAMACIRFHSDFIQRGISRKGDNSDKKKMYVKYFSKRNPYMKFQNPSMQVSCRTDARTYARTDRQPKTNVPHQLQLGA